MVCFWEGAGTITPALAGAGTEAERPLAGSAILVPALVYLPVKIEYWIVDARKTHLLYAYNYRLHLFIT
jgi:hypothetical protein